MPSHSGGFAAGGQFRVMWDDENLYVFIDVADRDHSYNANPGSNFINNNVVQMPIKPGPNAGKFIFDLIATSNVGTPLVWENWVIPGNVDIPIAGIVTSPPPPPPPSAVTQLKPLSRGHSYNLTLLVKA